MTTPFAHGDHTYTFLKRGSEVIPVRDDGAMPWSTYRSYIVKDEEALSTVHAYTPALATQRECKQLIIGDLANMTTSVHRVYWSQTAYGASKMREIEDANELTPSG